MKRDDGAVFRREDGVVIIDPVKARGKKDIVGSCPYGAIWWNEDAQLAQKWIFDAHLLDRGWKEPRCVEVCPTAAMTSAKVGDAELADKVRDEGWEVLNPEFATRPRVFYKNLHRYQKCFIGGTLVATEKDVEDCVEGAVVELVRDGVVVATTKSDAFGEFKMDGFDRDSGTFEVAIRSARHRPARFAVTLGESRYLGTLSLEVA